MPYSKKKRYKRFIYKIIDALSFNAQIRDLVDSLNRKAELSEEKTLDLLSHPGGFTRAFHKRRIGIAESYIRIARELDRSNYQKRLHALKTLVELSLHAKTVSMPLNTARVQIELMKEAIKNLENKRKQMEMVADFSLASYGHESVIRRFLKELKRIEVPEKGMPLRELELGWDSHVHDNLSEGRKTPSQLILDAFIKGLSRLTLAYYDIPDREIIFEAMEAGKILGIDVSVGIEFSVGPKSFRKHFMYVPPTTGSSEFFNFFEAKKEALSSFINGLEENRERRRKTITAILENFNNTHRINLNEGYEDESIFSLRPLRIEDLEKIVPHGQFSRNHLSELLYTALKDSLKKRTLALKVQYEVSEKLSRIGEISDWELEQIREAYRETREQYISLSPHELGTAYLSGKNIVDYDSVFSLEEDILPILRKVGGDIIYHRPLVRGLPKAISTVLNEYLFIDKIELVNMRDSVTRNPSEIIQLSQFIDLINNHKPSELKKFFHDRNININLNLIEKASEYYHQKPLVPLVGSAATGWDPHIPGMGFIRESSIPLKLRKHFIKTHYDLPALASLLISTQGKNGDSDEDKTISPEHRIFCLGKKKGRFKPNLVGDEEYFEAIGFRRIWRYLNPAVKNTLRVAIGLIPAYLWVGTLYTLIWFGITFFRNVFVDMIALSGSRPKAWSFRDINFDNATQSLFWTGFSVPILGLVKQGFDVVWLLPHEGLLFEWSKFFAICIANGTYIAIHNKIRRFDNRVILANFFRSILAWPFASLFAPFGNLMMVPSIVQAKFWSDVVAAIIEGTGKFRQKIVLRKRDLIEIFPLLSSDDKAVRLTAMLDILYIWAKRKRGKTCLSGLLCYHRNIFSYLYQKLRDAGKNSSEEHALCNERLDLLLNLFDPQLAYLEFSDFILKKYTSHEAIVLTELINTNLVAFYMWLKRLK